MSIGTESIEARKDLQARRILRDLARPLASLRLTVILLVLGMVLVFCGTLAQIDQGIWQVVRTYFRSLVVWIPFQLFFPRSIQVGGGFPFPGGWLIGGLLMINLLAAHAARFRFTLSRAGILLVHSGLVVLLLSEVVTGLFAEEGNMTIDVGGSSNFTEDSREVELAFVDPSEPGAERVTVVPQRRLREGMIRHPLLPADLRIEKFMENSVIREAEEAGGRLVAEERPVVSGSEAGQGGNVPSVYVSLMEKNGAALLGTYLFSLLLKPQEVRIGATTWQVSLRFRRRYKPYTLHLIEFKHEKYPGTEIPKNFSSLVRIVDPSRGVARTHLIYMNHPLRYQGETFYQASFKPDDSGTVLQVVRNPGWLLPYVSCAIVTLGLLVQFLQSLGRFLRQK